MVCTYKYLHENQYVTYLIHQFSLRVSCYRIPNLAAAQMGLHALSPLSHENSKLPHPAASSPPFWIERKGGRVPLSWIVTQFVSASGLAHGRVFPVHSLSFAPPRRRCAPRAASQSPRGRTRKRQRAASLLPAKAKPGSDSVMQRLMNGGGASRGRGRCHKSHRKQS